MRGSVAIAAGLALAITLGAARGAAQSEAYDAVIAQAVDAFEHERYVEARRLFTEAHALLPSPRTLRGIGLCALEIGDFAAAYHELSAALAMQGGTNPLTPALRTQVEQMRERARLHVGLYTGLPAGATMQIGDGTIEPEPDGALALADGERVVTIRFADGREESLTLQVTGGATESLPDLGTAAVTTTTGTTTTTDARELGTPIVTDATVGSASTSHLDVVEDDHATEAPAPPERTLALELALSVRGGSRNSGAGSAFLPMSGCLGTALTGTLITRLEPGLWLGGGVTLEYAFLTEADTSSFASMLAHSSHTRGWFEGDLHAVLHYVPSGTPLVVAASLGPALVFRDETTIDVVTLQRVNTSTNAFGVSVTASARLAFADDRLFVGAEVHAVATGYPAIELGLVAGGAPL